MTATSFASATRRVITIARESTFGTIAANNSSARQLRRINATPNIGKDAYNSNEILPSQQVRDARHGVRRPSFQLVGQLSPGAYIDFVEGILRRPYGTAATTGAQTNISASSTGNTFTRAAGSFITDGFRVGDVVRWTGWNAPATGNNNKNMRIISLTATVMTVDVAVTTRAAGDSVTCTLVGKKTFIPASSQSLYSYSIEDFSPDTDPVTSDRYTGMVMQALQIQMPPTGIVQIAASMMGQNMSAASSQYFTNATGITSDNSIAAVSGKLRMNGSDVANITGASLQIVNPLEMNPVVGSNVVPFIFRGPVTVSGQFQAYFTDTIIRDLFLNENEFELWFYMTSDLTDNSGFVSIVMNKVKLMSSQKGDSPTSIIQNFAFTALEVADGVSARDQTTIAIQDSAAP